MRTLIDIDDNLYTRLFDNGIEDHEMSNDDVSAMATAIRKGTPISKGFEEFMTTIFKQRQESEEV